MSATARTRTKGSVIASSPLLAQPRVSKQPEASNSMAPLIAKLANLRERYLQEMQAARKKVKKNFLTK